MTRQEKYISLYPSYGYGGDNKADLHIHTTCSDGSLAPGEVFLRALEHGRLHSLALTDHDSIDGHKEAEDYAKRTGIIFIPGIETTAREGHVLGLNIRERIDPGLSLRETIGEIHKQKGLAVIAHPGLPYARSVSFQNVKMLLQDDPMYHPDGIEIFNGTAGMLGRFDKGFIFNNSNRKALQAYLGNKWYTLMAPTGGSDLHGWTFTGVTTYKGNSVLQAITERTTGVEKLQRGIVEDAIEVAQFIKNAVIYDALYAHTIIPDIKQIPQFFKRKRYNRK